MWLAHPNPVKPPPDTQLSISMRRMCFGSLVSIIRAPKQKEAARMPPPEKATPVVSSASMASAPTLSVEACGVAAAYPASMRLRAVMASTSNRWRHASPSNWSGS
jgi:hypothetical protein